MRDPMEVSESGPFTETGDEMVDPSSTSEREARVLHILRLTERIDELRKITPGRGLWRFALPIWAVISLGANAFLGIPWAFLLKLGLGTGFVVGYFELVMWWYTKKIEAWEQEIEDARRLISDTGTQTPRREPLRR